MKTVLIGLLAVVSWFFFSIIYPDRCFRHTLALDKTALDIKILSEAVKLYRLELNFLPRSLQDLVPKYASEIPIDVWDRDYIYESTSDGYQISTYGSDAAKGGIGASADIHSDMTKEEFEKIVESIKRPIWGCNS
ncbi:type II secretion system protein GspG [Pseudoalteromonas luteoviolacea]|uniref:type II secretion system protein GspG n=1 Tax=Pseudoalteromonas luteoviolacea TaxID=43657 RepID=UPI001B363885|nr:type II secretion system protein GspG [Pseudoalteromonas luteoviolacea]MBQ4812425.1 type II secretion system protein GspG [Pseudoalteromonas luteoviolacea]